MRVVIIPWDEPTFYGTSEEACRIAHADCPEPRPSAVAEMELVKRFLRAHGFPEATVTDARSIDEVLRHIDHWIVRRDGRPRAH